MQSILPYILFTSVTFSWNLDHIPAFSIENFKRDQEEVENLLDLFREKIRLLIAEEKKLAEHGVRVKIIGKRRDLSCPIVACSDYRKS